MAKHGALTICVLLGVAAAVTARPATTAQHVPSALSPPRDGGMPCQGLECLVNYVNKDDGMFSWVDTGMRLTGHNEALIPGKQLNWTGYCLNVTSQQWLTPNDTTRSVWWHAVVVVVPSNLRRLDTGAVYITGGSNDNPSNAFPQQGKLDEDMEVAAILAMRSGLVTTVLFQVPNQHMTFPSDPKQQSRSEDAIIAYTWKKFIESPSTYYEWPLRLPMTKAAVKTMDAIAQFTATLSPVPGGGTLDIKKFVVAGASKRGWTTWTVGAVDERVIGIVPIVMDELNFNKNIHHHYRAYGGWSFALQDYYAENFTMHLDDANMQLLMDIVDPYNYLDKYTMPKLVVNAGNDEFFLPDDSRYWLPDMPKPCHFLIVPNAEHSEITGIGEVLPAIATFASAVASGAQVPDYSYEISSDGRDIVVHTGADGTVPKAVTMWYAHTCDEKRRDFRVLNGYENCLPCGVFVDKGGATCLNARIFWHSETLQENPAGSGVFTAHQDPLDDGRWTAFFVDVVYEGSPNREAGNGTTNVEDWPFLPFGDFDFTTMVSIIPQTFPFEDCHGASCQGKLV